MKAIFLGLPENDLQDYSVEEGKQVVLHEGEVCEATLNIGTMSSEPEEDFYNLVFADGFKMYDVSGYHLEEIK